MRVGWKTLSAFTLVLGAGVAVFALLPRWVSEHPIEPIEAIEPIEPIEPTELVEPVEDVEDVPEAPPIVIGAPEIVEAPADVPEPAPLPPLDSPVEAAPSDADVLGDAFASAMTEALSALKNEEYSVARAAFERAKSLRPEAPEVASGLSQVEEGLRNRAIAGHHDRGLEHERLESWRAAEAEYDAALGLDGSLRFAREGKKRTAALAHLSEKLDFQISHPERLSDARALDEASRLLDEARGTEGEGPKRRDAIAKLEGLVASYSRPMEVSIVSDTLTDVTLHRIGRLGKFDRRVLEVRPGRYVAVGSRAGFRDVRVEFTVEPGKPLAPIRVLCEEAI